MLRPELAASRGRPPRAPDPETQLPIADAGRITTEVASALDCAHRHNVIHRNLKPENILLHDGRALVADFGIALAASKAGGARMTQTGMSLGTPTYMSPEQAMGERGDALLPHPLIRRVGDPCDSDPGRRQPHPGAVRRSRPAARALRLHD